MIGVVGFGFVGQSVYGNIKEYSDAVFYDIKEDTDTSKMIKIGELEGFLCKLMEEEGQFFSFSLPP